MRRNTPGYPFKTLALLVTAGVLLLAGTLAAQPGKGGRGQGGQRLIEYLGLDEGQQAQWESIRKGQREASEEAFVQVRANASDLRELLEAGNADATEVGQLVLDDHALKQELKAGREAVEAQLMAILTPEQQEEKTPVMADQHHR